MDFTGGDIYLSSFDPKAYLTSFYSAGSERDNIVKFRLQKLHETFGPGGISGDVLIDIGSGPSIYQFLSACESFPHIIATDFTDQNRQELEKWLHNDPEAFDWSKIVKTACEIEGKRDKWEEKQDKLRSRLRKVLKCDVTESNPLGPVEVPPADCLTTSFCLETACKDLEAYRRAIHNITKLLRPGGHLVVLGSLGNTYYTVQGKNFSCLPLDEDDVKGAVTQAGYTIQSAEVFQISDRMAQLQTADSVANIVLVAKKEAENVTG
ncbi:PREDICTED: nicotinamide N-methyltransferase-like isoform X2 [Nanorana parkeri]|uniref:nicotinamide N-methyltransferase-like isoform X2 n=1 Tax=Nanorana parkeri TaxID=125878 RepID=UPI0008547053|nr:PREDICTED: nicotinamide N-methyltransferase-like isoform X2 [Nanorana parkeri]